MSPAHNQALDQALLALRAPGLFLRLRERPLPDGILLLLKIAAGESHSRDEACALSGQAVEIVTEASVLFIQQVMFYPGSDSLRLLGVSLTAPYSQVKEHHRWLVRWLHPDRNTEQWDTVFADRVNRAWQDVRTPERRQDYSSRLRAAAPVGDWPSGAKLLVDSRPVVDWSSGDELVLSSLTIRRMPFMVMGGLVLAASAFLWLQYQLNRDASRDKAVAAASRAAPEISTVEAPPRVFEASEEVEMALPQSVDLPQLVSLPQPTSSPASMSVPPTSVAPPIKEPLQSAKAVASVVEAPAIVSVPPRPPAAARSAFPTRTQAVVARNEATRSPPNPVRPPPPVPPAAAIAKRPADVTAVANAVALADHISPSVAANPPGLESLIDAAGARAVIMRFRSAYSSGNISQFRDLLASKTFDDHGERRSILKAYGKLFETSASRRIEIHDPDWLTDGDTAVLIANYDAWIVPRGESRERHFFGKIRFDLRSEDGELRVARLRHDAAGG